MIVEKKYYIETPADGYWNTGRPTMVIEAEDEPAQPRRLKVLSPSHYAKSWPAVPKDSYIECSGPVRELSHREYVAYVHQLRPNIPLPRGYAEASPKTAEQSPLTLLTLKNGAKVPQATVVATMMSLKTLEQQQFVAFFDLVMFCRDSSYQFVPTPAGDSKAILKSYSIMNSGGGVHDDVKAIVLSAATGDGMKMTVQSPVAHQRT